MIVQALHDLGVVDLAVSELVLAGPVETIFLDFDKLVSLGAADGARLGRVLAFVDVTADEASEFLFHAIKVLNWSNSKFAFKNTFSFGTKQKKPLYFRQFDYIC